ncbi:SusD family protein [Prevotella sp. khp7]|uniref:RagB/SusD family nutrient uptake outer membrane protein n=1 Tax=Prevotella sp. khp7 TaxID=1761885 RepID=UPI0008C526C9|nr:RagB/SusD family nutrient uptake outer membrane protein [Prevotella sp. khp7]SEW23004.1 SusD family protein [Prevotella sp. khp7]
MRYNKISTIVLAAAMALGLSSCSGDYLDTVPSNKVSEGSINASLENLYIALNGIHKEMVSQETGYQCLGGEPGFMFCRDMEADDITWITNTWCKAAYLGWSCNMNESSGYNIKYWTIYYQWILNANKIIAGVEEAPMTDAALYNQVKGEALCIRAWAHFNLVQLYAKRYAAGGNNTQDGIPYRLTAVTEEQARNSVEEVYQLINADLDEACKLLVGINPGYHHYSEMVAWGLKARVAMAKQDYTNAATNAAKAIQLAEANGGALMQGDQLMCGFSDICSDTKEAMYAARTPDDKTVYFYSFYAYMSWNFNATAIRQGVKCINADTYDTMSETDLRRAWFDPTGEMDVPAKTYVKQPYQNRKFTARSSADAVGDVAFMRLAEMYLTEAEALARAGQTAQAQEVFTKFQVTRDPSYVSKGNAGDALAEEIMNSRRVELWGEGFRFYDLKRLNLPIHRGRNFVQTFCTFIDKEAGADGWVWEIPKNETDFNKLCTKNY